MVRQHLEYLVELERAQMTRQHWHTGIIAFGPALSPVRRPQGKGLSLAAARRRETDWTLSDEARDKLWPYGRIGQALGVSPFMGVTTSEKVSARKGRNGVL